MVSASPPVVPRILFPCPPLCPLFVPKMNFVSPRSPPLTPFLVLFPLPSSKDVLLISLNSSSFSLTEASYFFTLFQVGPFSRFFRFLLNLCPFILRFSSASLPPPSLSVSPPREVISPPLDAVFKRARSGRQREGVGCLGLRQCPAPLGRPDFGIPVPLRPLVRKNDPLEVPPAIRGHEPFFSPFSY